MSFWTLTYLVLVFLAGGIGLRYVMRRYARHKWQSNPKLLEGQVVLVTGASRGVGKGIALGLVEAGATVYVAARTAKPGTGVISVGSLEETVAECTELAEKAGSTGRAIPIQYDARDVDSLHALIDRILADTDGQGLDLLVNCAFSLSEEAALGKQSGQHFWKDDAERDYEAFDRCFDVNVRSHYILCRGFVPAMVKRGRGLIINVSSLGSQTKLLDVNYHSTKAALDRFTLDAHTELGRTGVSMLSLWPGTVRTERIRAAREIFARNMRFDVLKENSESSQFVGRCVAALSALPPKQQRTWAPGPVTTSTICKHFGIVDLDGSQPRPLTPTWMVLNYIYYSLRALIKGPPKLD